MKWISFSAFENEGIVKDITEEISTPSAAQDMPPCPLFLFDDYHQDSLLSVNNLDLQQDFRWQNSGLREYLLLLGPQPRAFSVRAPPAYLVHT